MCVLTADAVGGSQNVIAFIDMIPVSELGLALMKACDDGYNAIVGSTARMPILFTDYSRHPNNLQVFYDKHGKQLKSTAAGRYQILYRYFVAYQKQLKLPDFGKMSQDRIALQLMREVGADKLLKDGRIVEAIAAAASRWASFPGAGYDQHEQEIDMLIAAYKRNGGLLVAG